MSVLGYGCLMILSSIPVYLIFIAWKNKPKFFQKGVGKSNERNTIRAICHLNQVERYNRLAEILSS